MPKKRAKKKLSALSIILLTMIIIGLSSIFYVNQLFQPVKLTEEVSLSINPGSSASQIAQMLYDNGLIRNTYVFRYYVRKQGIANDLRSGDYNFSGSIGLDDIVDKLLQGQAAEDIKVTIPEGLTIAQTADIFADKGLVDKDKFIEYAETGDFPYNYLPPQGTENRLEGFLFPDTYRIDPDWTEKEIIDLLLAQFDKVWTDQWQERSNELSFSVLETVTLASLIEKEAKTDEDRPLISSVFHNRLEIGMLLQSCATIQYILGEPKSPLLNEDLQIPSPYNTYIHEGLPPGPIASPGKASLEAALYYQETNYYYFLAKPDGSHYFSKTLAEHNAAKQEYINN